ncbi:MAG: hypothetical protein ABI868_15660 [Acidobacteriota bacterium]
MRVRTVLALLLLTLCASPAHAGWWWDYFDGLSGPGPFQTDRSSPTLEATFWPNKDLKHLLLDDPAPKGKKWYVAVRTVGLNNDEHLQMFDDTPLDRRHVNLRTFDFSMMYRFSPLLDLGGGLSLLRFSGSDDDPVRFDPFYRVGPIGKMTVTPFAGLRPNTQNNRVFWLQRVPKFYADLTVVKGFEASEFGNPQHSAFSTSVETKVRAGLTFDVSAIFCAVKRCSMTVPTRTTR